MLKVYGRPNSSNSAKVFWLLDELNLPFDLVLTGRGYAPTDTPAFLAMNPFGKVPVVLDGDVAVWESNAVLRYLATRYGPTPLWPENGLVRARVDGWMDWSSISLTPPLTRLRKARAAGRSGDGELPAVLAAFAALDARLSQNDFLSGNEFSLADIVAAPSVLRGLRLPEAGSQFSAVRTYLDRLAKRPGFDQHVRTPLG